MFIVPNSLIRVKSVSGCRLGSARRGQLGMYVVDGLMFVVSYTNLERLFKYGEYNLYHLFQYLHPPLLFSFYVDLYVHFKFNAINCSISVNSRKR